MRSERMLMQQLDYNLLFRWFVGIDIEAVWNHAVFSKNRERLLNEKIAHEFFKQVLEQAQPHLSKEHFSVDGTLIEAWASQKSFSRRMASTAMAPTFTGNSGATTRTNPAPTLTPNCIVSRAGARPS